MVRVGVDEAGKGPVLGSMFAAAVAAPPEVLPEAVDDSKSLSSESRQHIESTLRSTAGVSIGLAEVPVDRIDAPETDMTEVTVNSHITAIRTLDPPDGTTVHCDAGETNAERFGSRVADGLERAVSVRASHRADVTDPIVGAASIVAKVAREDHVDRLKEEYGPVGSGYPADSSTRDFLADYVAAHGELPDCARRSWATSQDVLAAARQSDLESF